MVYVNQSGAGYEKINLACGSSEESSAAQVGKHTRQGSVKTRRSLSPIDLQHLVGAHMLFPLMYGSAAACAILKGILRPWPWGGSTRSRSTEVAQAFVRGLGASFVRHQQSSRLSLSTTYFKPLMDLFDSESIPLVSERLHFLLHEFPPEFTRR